MGFHLSCVLLLAYPAGISATKNIPLASFKEVLMLGMMCGLQIPFNHG